MYRFLVIIYTLLISLPLSAYEHTYPDLNDLDAILNKHNEITFAKIQSIESKKYILVNGAPFEKMIMLQHIADFGIPQ